jgi:hypothetical protein
MKEIFDFLAWQWNKWQGWQRVYAVSMCMIATGFVMPGVIGALLLVVGVTSILSWLFKWAIWDSVSNAYTEFKKEKQEDEQIKNS